MNTFDVSMTEQFTQLLQRREEELRQAISALTSDDEPAAAHEVSDFKEVALRSTDAAMDDHLAQRLELALQHVLSARRRLQNHQFGQCLGCGEPIDVRRLMTLPEAELCTACQGRQEHRH